jgi:ribose transport system substrate-binding protein
VKIGVLLKDRSAFWEAMQKGAESAGAKLGADVMVKAPMNETDIAVQIRLLQVLASQGIQALVIAPANKDSLAGPVAALAAKGVKIVDVDSPLSGSAGSVFVGTDQHAAGAAGGELLASLVADGDEIAILKHSQTSGATSQREAGAIEKLRSAHPRLDIHGDIYASAEPGREAEQAALLLANYPGVKGIFASGTSGTMAMLDKLSERKPQGIIKFIGCGFNLNPAVVKGIQSGVMTGWIAQLPQDVGYKAVESALALVNGQAVPPVVSTDFLVVTKDNLSDPKVQALLSL